MRISVFGLGYVGTVCAACFARRGHNVIGVDRIDAKVDLIRSGHSPVVERDINELIESAVRSGHLTATADPIEAVKSTDMSTVCVGTRSKATVRPRHCEQPNIPSRGRGRRLRAPDRRHDHQEGISNRPTLVAAG